MNISSLLRRRVSRLEVAVCCLLCTLFVVAMVVAFYTPGKGFTRLLRIPQYSFPEAVVPQMRELPVYLHEKGYDGSIYAQLALDPLLENASENRGLVPYSIYRARRMLTPLLAYCLGGGDPWLVVNVYALLNPLFWFVWMFLVFSVVRPRNVWQLLCVGALLLSAGAMDSIRLALTDLPAAVLILIGVKLLQDTKSPRFAGSSLAFAAATLCRETSVLSVTAYCSRNNFKKGKLFRATAAVAVVAFVPAVWHMVVLYRLGAGATRIGTPIEWPLMGYAEAIYGLLHDGQFGGLQVALMLSLIALITQMVYFFKFPDFRDPFWRIGLVYVLLALCFHVLTVEFDAALNRCVLPLTLCFNVLLARNRRYPLHWLLLGNLSVISGVTKFLQNVLTDM